MKPRISILILLGLTFLVHPAEALIKRSSEKECTVCHVLWLDAFSTDKKTLLGPYESNIVIAGSVGLSSSRQMCESCHDGYVTDSRAVIEAGNKHHQIKNVPDGFKLPVDLRLDINNEFYCGTCHGFHDIKEMSEIGSIPFMRMDNERSEMCIACHNDKIEKSGHDNHPLFKKRDSIPTKIIERLGGKFSGPENEIICQSCHLPHGKSVTLASSKESELCLLCHEDKDEVMDSKHDVRFSPAQSKNIKGQTADQFGTCSACHVPHKGVGEKIWARIPGPGSGVSRLCLSCHGRETDVKDIGDYSHSVGMMPSAEARPKDLPLYPVDNQSESLSTVQCSTCHNVHRFDPVDPNNKGKGLKDGDSSNSFLRLANKNSDLCLNCHKNKETVLESDHNLILTAPEEENTQGASAEVSGPCGVCHISHNAKGKGLWSKEPQPGNPASWICLDCHKEERVHIKKSIGEYSHPIDCDPSVTGAVSPQFPLYNNDGIKASSGTIQCGTCHDVHKWSAGDQSYEGKKDEEGDSSNSFLRMPNTSSSNLCIECHGDKKQLLNSDHNLEVTAPKAQNIEEHNVKTSGPCGACHIPHNATGPGMWAAKLSGTGDYVTQQCVGCHSSDGIAKEKVIGEYYHPVNVPLEDPNKNDLQGKDQSKLPLYDSEGKSGSGDRMTCLTCHEPHTWDPKLAEYRSGITLENREGNMATSFLREVNIPSSNLCEKCHIVNGYVEGTDHDLNVTAPDARNLLDQTVKVSGVCGACHLVHNSPNKLKLWARPYGKIPEDDNIMAALCWECHSESGIASDKVPLIATHPKGKLINNTRLSRKGNQTPIFDEDGMEVDAGDIACPSCHNAHQWDPRYKRKGPNKNLDGSAMNSFLRNTSYNIICMDCHGADTIYRYMNFHNPKIRTAN